MLLDNGTPKECNAVRNAVAHKEKECLARLTHLTCCLQVQFEVSSELRVAVGRCALAGVRL